MEINRAEWKKNYKKKGKYQRQRIKEWNCQLTKGASKRSYVTNNPKTRRENLED